jgi:hypothetical protein
VISSALTGNQKDVAMNAENPVQIDLLGVSATRTKDTRLAEHIGGSRAQAAYVLAGRWDPGGSFGAHAMDHIPDEDAPAVARAARAAVREAVNAGVYVSASGLETQPASIVATDGAVADGPCPQAIGGFTLLDVPSREEALRWAAKIAVACRWAQEVREVGADPELDAMLRQADSRR